MLDGIAGQLANTGIIENCYITGNINTSVSSVGGITGYTTGIINNCYSNVNIVNNIQIKETAGRELKMGGIAATLSSTGTITNSYNLGTIKCTSTKMNLKLGGILGESNSTNYISNCYNLGNIICDSENVEKVYVGGIVGYIKNATISNCCNNSTINVINNTIALGAILGYNYNNGIVNGCYYYKDNIENGVGQGVGSAIKIDDEKNMPNILSILGNAFKEDTNNVNNGYPILNW